MIASIEDDYPRNEFLSFLTSAHFPEIPALVKEWAVAYANKAGILKGKYSWLSMKTVLLNFSGEQFTKDEESRVAEVQEGIRSVIEILDEIKSAKDLASYMENLENVLNKFGFMESLDESLSEALSSLFLELRQFSGMSGAGSKEAGIYLRHLFTGLSGGDADKDGVRIVPYEFAAGHESRALFLGGMVENEFPSKPGIDPILPEKVKKALGMPFLEYYLERQKRYFKRLINVPLLEPYFSCPSAEGDKPFLPSPFLDWGQSLTPAELNLPSDEERLIAEGFSEQKEFTGILWNGELPEEREIKNLLSKRFGQDAFISVTDIETYRKCPLRFYIEKVLRLEIEKPPKFEVEAMLWGKLAHKVMEYLYKDGDIGLKDINSRIMQGLKLTLAEFPLGDFWSKVAGEIFQRLIPMIEAQEAEIKMQGFMPHASEKGLKAEINGLRLKGKIDRIDKKIQDAGFRMQDSFILLDYKTGSIDKDSLQLPLYSAMLQKENEGIVERAGFYSLKDGGIVWYPAKKQGLEEFLQYALQITKELVQKMREGMFMPSEVKETECRYCQHRALCKGGG
jgi:ATP-dependent helicase/DNAse subunit B